MAEGVAAALFRTWFKEVWNERKRDRIDAYVAPQCKIHALAEGNTVVVGPDGFRPFYDQLCKAFSNIHFDVHELVGTDAMAAGRWSVRMTHSGEGMGDAVPFDAALAWGAKVLAPLLDVPLPARTLVNVNFPALPADQVKGIRVVRQGFHDYSRGTVVEGRDPRGYPYYWFGLEAIEHTLDRGTDLEAIAEGYVAVTPLQLDLTHHASLGELGERFG